MFAASFDSKMGCLYSVFDAKKHGKPAWVVRMKNWKLREGENRLSGLLEGVSVSGNYDFRVYGSVNKQLGRYALFEELYSLLLHGGTETFREGFETFSMKVPKPCPKVSIPLMKILILPERFVLLISIFYKLVPRCGCVQLVELEALVWAENLHASMKHD
ncbi:hypothetical protein GQ457_01G035110 [Hibiscus cannabinus]